MATSLAPSTRERLLDAAERLFERRGSGGTSLRSITAAAGTNVAAVHYHFGSKGELLRAVVERRIGPVNRARLAALERLRGAGQPPPGVEAILRAFLAPLMTPDAAPAVREVSALLFREPDDTLGPLIGEIFGEVGDAFSAALGEALPGLPEDEVVARFQFVVGAMAHVVSGRFEMAIAAHGHEAPSTPARLESLLAFLAAGLRSPGPAAELRS